MVSAGWSGARELVLVAAALLPAIASASAAGTLFAWRHAGIFATRQADPSSATVLLQAVSASDLPAASAALRAGVSGSERGAYKNRDLFGRRHVQATPLYVAVAQGNEAMTRLLLGAGVDASDPSNSDAICIGARLGRTEPLRLLAVAGVNLAAAVCPDGPRAAAVARQNGHEETARLIESDNSGFLPPKLRGSVQLP